MLIDTDNYKYYSIFFFFYANLLIKTDKRVIHETYKVNHTNNYKGFTELLYKWIDTGIYSKYTIIV